jgi:hypothetical protein
MTHHFQIEVGLGGVIGGHEGGFFRSSMATLGIESQRDDSLASGRDGPIDTAGADTSARKHFPDFQDSLSLVLDLEFVLIVTVVRECPEIMKGILYLGGRCSLGGYHHRSGSRLSAALDLRPRVGTGQQDARDGNPKTQLEGKTHLPRSSLFWLMARAAGALAGE